MKISIFPFFLSLISSINFLNENEKILRYLKEIDNCYIYNNDNSTCIQCLTNYNLSSNGKSCEHYCNDIDYCNTCSIDNNNKTICSECIHPYKLKDGYCILKATTFTWIIMIYLIIIIVAAVLIFILIKPKLDSNEP